MRTSPPDRATLRRLLEQIPTDSDFDGFCLDYFPDAHRRFSSDMDRVAKINLLLQLVPDLTVIASKLRERFPALPEPAPVAGSARWIIAVLAGVAALGLVGYWVKDKGPASMVAPPAVRLPVDAAVVIEREMVPDGAVAGPSPVGTIVDHDGDIRAKGNVHISAPAAGTQTLVKTRGQIQAGGDVQIGVTAPSTPARRKDQR